MIKDIAQTLRLMWVSRKGALTTQTLVILAIIVIVMLILIYFVTGTGGKLLNLGDTAGKDMTTLT